MISSSDGLDSAQSQERLLVREGHVQVTYLEIAQRIARETLAADRQALELDGKLISIVRANRLLA